MKRDFDEWLNTMKGTISPPSYFADFEKVYKNVDEIKVELNILNALINSNNIEQDFLKLIKEYPNVLKAIPILLAKREREIETYDEESNTEFAYNFEAMNYTPEQYCVFMRNSGLFDLLEHHIINSLVDYVLGVEVGLDSNARKNRTGHIMEDLVESYLVKAGLVKGKTYFKEITNPELKEKFGADLEVGNAGDAGKRWDFAFVGAFDHIFVCECNFYHSGGGSKLNETARSYKELALEMKDNKKVHFIWFTDGRNGWKAARFNLLDTFNTLDTLFDINDLDNGIIETFTDSTKFVNYYLRDVD